MPVTESQRKANKKYLDGKWSQVKLSMPNDEATALRQYCKDHGISVAGFIRGLVHDAIESGTMPSWFPGAGTVADAVAGESGESGGTVPPVPHIQAAGGAGLPSHISESSEKA